MQACYQQSNEKRYDDGNIIKPHINIQTIFKQKTKPKIDNQKHPDGQQGYGIVFFHFFLLVEQMQICVMQ